MAAFAAEVVEKKSPETGGLKIGSTKSRPWGPPGGRTSNPKSLESYDVLKDRNQLSGDGKKKKKGGRGQSKSHAVQKKHWRLKNVPNTKVGCAKKKNGPKAVKKLLLGGGAGWRRQGEKPSNT